MPDCISKFLNISTSVTKQIHWLPLSARIQIKVLILVLGAQLGLATKHFCDPILRPSLSLRYVLLDSLIGLTALFSTEELLRLNPDPSPLPSYSLPFPAS